MEFNYQTGLEIKAYMEAEYSCVMQTLSVTSEEGWITLADTARGFRWETGNPRRPDSSKVSRLIGTGDLRDNFQSGKKRRVSKASIIDYSQKSGEAWNET